KQESNSGKTQTFHSSSSNSNRKLQNLVRRLDESTDNPVTNPANFAPFAATPTIVTVPASNPTTPVDSTPPTTTVPAATTPTTPTTNPANSGNVPVTNPNPPNQPTNSPSTQGQKTSLQDALDYACGIGGADCSTIQDGGSCYNPISLQNHASYAFNSYYQKNPSPTSCDFGGAAVLVNTNPSTGSCIFPSSATGTAAPDMPSSTTPTTDTPSSTMPTSSSPGTFGSSDGKILDLPPSLTNPSNPDSLFPATYGPNSPPLSNTYPAVQLLCDLTLPAFFPRKMRTICRDEVYIVRCSRLEIASIKADN
ncbi:Glucan endo-1 3-beta-glucosidase 1, partial [Bienertia sinuspersici]